MLRFLTATTAATLAIAPAAFAEPATIDIGANGNVFTGGLSFTPSKLTAKVGDIVRVTNTDFLVAHTFTERHQLWNLTGDYLKTPISEPGFPPGSVQQRTFEAGTAQFFCIVHPTTMTGTIAVPVTLALSSRTVRTKRGRKHKVRDITATWAPAAPADGEGFDVEVQRGNGPWLLVQDGKRSTSMTFPARRKGTITRVRARLRSLAQASRGTDFSPVAEVVSDAE